MFKIFQNICFYTTFLALLHLTISLPAIGGIQGTPPNLTYCGGDASKPCESVDYDDEDSLRRAHEYVLEEIDRLNEKNQRLSDQLKTELVKTQKVELFALQLIAIKRVSEEFQSKSEALEADLHSASEQHINWIKSFQLLVSNSVPIWEQITDLTSYQDALADIALFNQKTPEDISLTLREKKLQERLKIREPIKLAGELEYYLSSTTLIEDVLFDQASQIRSSLKKMKDQFLRLGKKNVLQLSLLHTYQRIRNHLKTKIPLTWQAIARQRLQQINTALALEITDNYQNAMNDPIVYFSTTNQISRLQNELIALLDYDYSPLSALRKVRILEILLNDMSSNLSELTITEQMRNQVELEIAAGWSIYDVYKEYIEKMGEIDLAIYADMRSFEVEMIMIYETDQLLENCHSLATEAVVQNTSIEDEIRYQEFIQLCAQ